MVSSDAWCHVVRWVAGGGGWWVSWRVVAVLDVVAGGGGWWRVVASGACSDDCW